jgi:cytochrome b pre-mRNA-processing protein 3
MSLLARLFTTRPDPREALRPLWHRTVELSREPHWYAECGVADGDGDLARDTSLLVELFVSDMDAQVRELGVGDVVVGKHIGKLVGALGGRISAYFAGTMKGRERMEEAVQRNVTFAEGGSAACVADKLLLLAERLARTDEDALLAGQIAV